MNWDAIGAIAELLGAVGVIGSLIYVASQVRASTVASRVESKMRMTENMVKYGDMLLENPKLNELMILARQGTEDLSKNDYLRFSNLSLKACWYLSSAFFMYQQKSISADDWHEMKTIAIYWATSKGFQQWWADRGSLSFTGEFKNYIEQQIKTAKQSTENRVT